MSSYKFRQELTRDPESRGYAAMTAAQVLADIQIPFRPLPDLESITDSQLYDVVNKTEFGSMSASDRSRVRDLYKLGTIDVRPGSPQRLDLEDIFTATGTGSTRQELGRLITGRTQNTREFLGLRPSLLRESAVKACRVPSQPDGPSVP